MGPIAPYTRLRTQAKAPNTVEMWKTKDTAIVSVIAKGQQAVMIWSPSPLVPGTGTMYLNLQWHSDWMGQVLHAPAWRTAQSLWDTVILMQLGPMQTRDTGTRTHTIKTGEKVRVLLWHIPLPLYQPTPARSTFSGQSPMAAATLSKDQATSIIPIDPTKCLSIWSQTSAVPVALSFWVGRERHLCHIQIECCIHIEIC